MVSVPIRGGELGQDEVTAITSVIDARFKEIASRFDRVDKDIGEVKTEQKATNGRLRKLEQFRTIIVTVGTLLIFAAANGAAWVALASR